MVQMVTDRTEADLIQGNAKGIYGYTDLNRVESAVAELFEMANEMGYNFTSEVKTDWAAPGPFSVDDWPTEGQMERYLNNVKSLASAFSVSQAQLPRTMVGLSFMGANAIEQCLEDVHAVIQSIIQNYKYCGELYAGEVN